MQLDVALLGEVLEVNGAVFHSCCDFLVSGQVVFSRQVVALNDLFVMYFCQLNVAFSMVQQGDRIMPLSTMSISPTNFTVSLASSPSGQLE